MKEHVNQLLAENRRAVTEQQTKKKNGVYIGYKKGTSNGSVFEKSFQDWLERLRIFNREVSRTGHCRRTASVGKNSCHTLNKARTSIRTGSGLLRVENGLDQANQPVQEQVFFRAVRIVSHRSTDG